MNEIERAKEQLGGGLDALGIDATRDQAGRMVDYLVLMRKWNRTHNLTAITDLPSMVTRHLLDAASIQPYLAGPSLLDVGSGAGVPGLPLALLQPKLEVVSLDSRGKRIEFQRFAALRLGLTNVRFVHARIEDYQPGMKFDTLVARAFATISEFAGACEHLQEPGTRLIAMKGRHPREEIEALPDPVRDLCRVERISVPGLQAERHLAIIDY